MRVFLMSIKPKWARELYREKKTVEFRKSSPPLNSLVFLYESAPVRPPQSWQALRAVNPRENALAQSLLHLIKCAVSNEVSND